jgi:hypothetical protein
MDLAGMDLLVAEDGKEYILEVNSSSIGLSPRHFDEDMGYIREFVLEKVATMRQGGPASDDESDS